MTRYCKEGAGAQQRRSRSEGWMFATRCQLGFMLWNLGLQLSLSLVLCIHNINSCVRCIGWLYIWFTFGKCNMSSTNKMSTSVLACFKKTISTQSYFARMIKKIGQTQRRRIDNFVNNIFKLDPISIRSEKMKNWKTVISISFSYHGCGSSASRAFWI